MSLLLVGISGCEDDELTLIKEVVITWENPADLVVGLPLTEEQLNATANVPGSFVYTPPVGTVLDKGDNQELTAEFTPRDSKYPKMTKTVTINVVDKYIPVITWENPGILAAGSPLTEEQLNATADVPGTFVYDPPLGTVLPVGENQELKVTFTPSVPTHQATSKTVFINVRDVVPLKFAGVAEWSGRYTITLKLSDQVGNLGDSPEVGFTVHILNDPRSVDRDVSVKSVSIDPDDNNRVILTLAEAIYGDDKITVALNADGNTIKSADDQPLLSFESTPVSIPVTGDDLLADKKNWAGFEGTGGANAAGAFGYWVGAAEPWQRTTEMAASGDASMKYFGGFDVKPLFGMNFGESVDIEAGAYEVRHKIYIEAGSDLKALRTAIARKSKGWVDDVSAVWDVSNVKRGEWVTIKQIMSFPVAYNASDKTRYTYYVESALNPGVTGNQTFYLDDMELRKVDAGARPE